jgi:hypothetical protein
MHTIRRVILSMLWASPIIFVSPSQLQILVDQRHRHNSVLRLSQFSKNSLKNVCSAAHEMWRPARIRGGCSTQDCNSMQDVGSNVPLPASESVDPMDIDARVPIDTNSNKSNLNLVIFPIETRPLQTVRHELSPTLLFFFLVPRMYSFCAFS